jgi:hypothetical protein
MNEREWHDEAMRLATQMMRDSWATGGDASWQPAYQALAAHLRTRPSAEPLPVAQGEREAFEAWAGPQGFNIDHYYDDTDGCYHRASTRWAWIAWQAARATAPSATTAELSGDAIRSECNRLFAADTEYHNPDTWFERGVRFAERHHRIDFLAAAPRLWPVEEQPDGTVTPVDPSDLAKATAPRVRELSDGEIDYVLPEVKPGMTVVEYGRAVARAVLAAAGKEKP